MNPTFWTAVKPIASQGARDFLRIAGTALAAHGYIDSGAGTEAFIGAGMTLAGLFWGWFTTVGYLKVGALLKKLTAAKTPADAVAAAQVLPPAAAVDTAAKSAAAQSVAKVLVAAVLFGSLVFAGDARAQGKLTGNLVKDIAAATSANKPVASSGSLPSNILGALDDKLLPDLQYALKLAEASGSKVTAPCYQAWIDIIQTRQKAVTNADGSPMDLPQPRLITDFEKAVELRNALQPESAFSIACAPVIVMVKLDILSFMGKVIGGGAGLATLVPGL